MAPTSREAALEDPFEKLTLNPEAGMEFVQGETEISSVKFF